MMVENELKQDVFQLKGRLYTLTVLELAQTDRQALGAKLQAVIKQAPKLFLNAPIVLDLALTKGVSFDLGGVIESLREVKMMPIAVQNASVVQQQSAVKLGLGVITASAKRDNEKIAEFASKESSQSAPASKPDSEHDTQVAPETTISAPLQSAKLITSPVRSGQQIYAKNKDLIVMASVSHGAELLADGHIHVYGPLRGRALAGLNGDKSARIFCQSLEAELVAIAGCYLLNENMEAHAGKGGKQIYLDKDEKLQVGNL